MLESKRLSRTNAPSDAQLRLQKMANELWADFQKHLKVLLSN